MKRNGNTTNTIKQTQRRQITMDNRPTHARQFRDYKSLYVFQLNELKDYLITIGSESTTEQELEELYDKYIDIEFDNRTIRIPFDAVSYDALIDLLTTLIMNV